MHLGWPQSIPLGTARANGAGMNETHDLGFLFFFGGVFLFFDTLSSLV